MVSNLERYEKSSVLRGLAQLIPGGAILEAVLLPALNAIEEDRIRTFFDELSAGRIQIDDDLAKSEDFLHKFFATTNAAVRSRRREKIRYLARLLRGSFGANSPLIVDEHEELLGIVEDLSYRELLILALLSKAESETEFEESENALQRANRLWPRFEQMATERLQLDAEQLQAMLVRLERSGCYAPITGTYWGYTGGRGHLTGLYRKLVETAGSIEEIGS